MSPENEQLQGDNIEESKNSKIRVYDKVFGWNWEHLFFGFLAGAIISSMLLLFPRIGKESLVMLVVFNFLFVFLIFPLEGRLSTKLLMLATGNIVGFVWNCIFSFLAILAYSSFEFCNTLYIILTPFLNLVWIVSYWSTSLAFLSGSQKTERSVMKA